MAITAADVMKLRKMTSAGMMDCKKALEEAEGDFNKAVGIIREKGKLPSVPTARPLKVRLRPVWQEERPFSYVWDVRQTSCLVTQTSRILQRPLQTWLSLTLQLILRLSRLARWLMAIL